MKRLLLFGLGVICISMLASAGAPGPKHAVEFTLEAPSNATSSCSPAMFFSLVATVAGPNGGGIIEDFSFPYSTALGWDALHSNIDGQNNVAIGRQALYSNTSGHANVAVGFYALYTNSTGGWNTACGNYTLSYNTTGICNTACGYGALHKNITGSQNTAYGLWALSENTTGSTNTACGRFALLGNTSGICNTALGDYAGYQCIEGSYNIYLGGGVTGDTSDTNTIRIGLPYDGTQQPPTGQNQTFIAGIKEHQFSAVGEATVVGITNDGQLGWMPDTLFPNKGEKGDTGATGPQGLAGEGLVTESLLFLTSGTTPPLGYTLLGNTDLSYMAPGAKKASKLTVTIYKKN